MSQPTPPVILVDGSSFLFRAYHALPPLTGPGGQPTNAIVGVTNMLRKLMAKYRSDYLAVVLDAPGKTFRHELYAAYKAHRPPMPEELRAQVAPLAAIIKAMGLPLLMEAGIEADDLLGVLARRAAESGHQVVIATGDKDLAQLVGDRIVLENTMADTRLDVDGVVAKFGVRPEQIADYLALTGDSVDNIPGVPNVGPKTAAKWLGQYYSLDNLIANADQIGGKAGQNLRASLPQLPLARRLATIRCDLDLPYQLDDLRQRPADIAALTEQLTGLGFASWLKALRTEAEAEPPPPPPAVAYETILSEQHLRRWLGLLAEAELFALDTETTSLDYGQARLVGLSFAAAPGQAAYLPLAHDYAGAPAQLGLEPALALLRPLLQDPARPKVGQNLKYDSHVLANHGITLAGIAHDTMLESYVLNSTATRHNMDDMAKTYLGHSTRHYEEVAGKGARQIPFGQVSLEQATFYAAEDADITLRLHHWLAPRLRRQPRLHAVYADIEMPLLPVLARMERNGVLVDTAKLARQSLELAEAIIAIERQAHQLVGHPFNLGSPKQIQEILYERLRLPVLKKTPKGQPSTDEAALQELAVDYPLPRLILEHRGLSKLKSTYLDKLPQQVAAATGRVHTSYHQAVTATGRLSSSDPNLQNIPIRSAEGRKIRQAFIAADGYKIVAADYSQIELRIMAHLSGDDGLIDAFRQGADIHRATAAEVFAVPADQVTAELRRSAKAINFGLIYGMSPFGLARQLGVGRAQAQAYMELYFARYPGVRRYMERIREQARAQGHVETLFGRRLHLPDINARDSASRQYAERTAINAPMQGSAADIIKRAMIAADRWLRHDQVDGRMIMQVHDELVFEIAERQLEAAVAQIRRLMASAAELSVPLLVDVGAGHNWDEAH